MKSKWIIWVLITFVSYRCCLSDTFCPDIPVTTLDVWEDGLLQASGLTENMVVESEGLVVKSSATSGPSAEGEFRSEAAGRSGGEQTVMLGYKILPAVLLLLCLNFGQVALLVAKVRASCCDPLLLQPATALFSLSPVRSQRLRSQHSTSRLLTNARWRHRGSVSFSWTHRTSSLRLRQRRHQCRSALCSYRVKAGILSCAQVKTL